MFVAYSWETPDSLQIVYAGPGGVTKDVKHAFQFDSYDAVVDYKKTLDVILASSVTREWFIGELEPTCRGYLGEFGEHIDG